MTAPLCPAIDVGLYLETNGSIKTCCTGKIALGNIKEQSLDQIFLHSKPFHDAKQELLDQKFPSYCVDCVKAEKVTPTISQYHAFKQSFLSTGKRDLQHIDLRWSNICNLNCRYCNSKYSSSWEKLHGIKPESVQRDYHASILEEVKKSYNSLKVVNLLGGEPLLQKQNEELIKSLRPDVEIVIFTNLSVVLESNTIYNLLKEKSRVRWFISFENVEDRFEYVRAGANWDRFKHNFNLLVEEKQHISVVPVYSIWSATRLMEYYEFISQYPIKQILWRYAQSWGGPLGTDVILPDGYNDTFTQIAIDQIDQVTKKYGFNNTLSDIKRYLEKTSEYPNRHTRFLEWTARQEAVVPTAKTFSDLWPEIYSSFAK